MHQVPRQHSPNDSPAAFVQAGYRYALSLTHHHYDAEDLVQQAWMKCHHRYGRVKNRTLLYTTIRNLFYDQCRRGKIVVFESIDGHPEPQVETQEHTHASADLDVLLAGLRVEEREALYLNAVEGHTAREIAEQTGTPRNTILSHLHRARRKLARALGCESGNTEVDSRNEEDQRHE